MSSEPHQPKPNDGDTKSSMPSEAASGEQNAQDGQPAAQAIGPRIDPWIGPLVRSFLAGNNRELLQDLQLHLPEPGTADEVETEGEAEGNVDGAIALPAKPAQTTDRGPLAQSLLEFNRSIEHPLAEELAALLADPEVEVVVTGQQAGLFGGPLYALSKALAATLWARALTNAGRKAVAVFWIASEDHDFQEVRSACFGEQTVSVPAVEDSTRPVGQRVVDERLLSHISAAISECASAVQAPPFLDQALDAASACYRQGEAFSLGFARLLPRMLGDWCPLLLDSQDPVLKRQQVTTVQRLLEPEAVRSAIEDLEERERAIEKAGFPLQIPSARGSDGSYALPLFLHRDGCRYRLVLNHQAPVDGAAMEPGPTEYALRGYDEQGTLEELAENIRQQPSWMSPSALLRPVLQDAALGTTLQVLGPGELAYLPQAAPLYHHLDVAPPSLSLRPQMVCLPQRYYDHALELLRQPEFSAEALLGPWPDLEKILAARADNGTLRSLQALRSETLDKLQALEPDLVALDAQLKAAVEKTGQHIDRGFDNFRSRVEKACAQQESVVRGRVDRLREFVVPDGKLQERTLCSLWLWAQFGENAVDDIAEHLSLDPTSLQVVPL